MESRSGTVQQKQLKLDNDQWELSTHHKHNHQTNVPKRLVQEEHRLGKFQYRFQHLRLIGKSHERLGRSKIQKISLFLSIFKIIF